MDKQNFVESSDCADVLVDINWAPHRAKA